MTFEAATLKQALLVTKVDAVKRAIQTRRDRLTFLPAHLFADPAWDMLLALYAAELDQIHLATSSLCDESQVPPTTALRWIGTLANEGLIEQHRDPSDARRVYVKLSPKGVESMAAYFQTNASSWSSDLMNNLMRQP